jgi:hypothetical protein
MSGCNHQRVLSSALTGFSGLTREEFRARMAELCERGLLTCTRGRPGDDDATYALGWLPLDGGNQFPPEVRERHRANMLRLQRTEGCA